MDIKTTKLRIVCLLLMIGLLVLAWKAYEAGISILWSAFLIIMGFIFVGKSFLRRSQ